MQPHAAGLLLLVGFAAASDASLIFLCDAADLTGATSYAELGERCFGRCGRASVMLCLLAMLVASVVIVLIVVTDVCAMLLTAAGLAVPRLAVVRHDRHHAHHAAAASVRGA